MDRVIYLFGALLMSAGIVILLGITPEIITQDIMSLMSRQRSLKYRVAKAQGKVKQNRLQTAIMNIKNALIATHSENKFSLLISVSLIGICAGFLLAALLQNLLLIPIFSGICVILPYAYVNVLLSNYNRRISEELETALSIITTNYVSNDDIIYAVEQSIDYINPPVQQAFRKFLTQTKLINSNVKLAIEQLKGEINNEIFHEWCDSLIECQDNVTLKKTRQAQFTTKLSNVLHNQCRTSEYADEPAPRTRYDGIYSAGKLPYSVLSQLRLVQGAIYRHLCRTGGQFHCQQ